MRAVQVKDFGEPEVLVPTELPDPVPGPGEVLVEVAAADTLFVETQLRRGWGREWFTVDLPYIPGNGVTGTVVTVGPDVDTRWVGRRVAAHTGERGGYANLAAVAVATVVEVPDALGLDQAAALLHDGVTALGLVDAVPVRSGDRVLVTAAAGGLGILLVQLAVAAGADVVGAARGGRKLELVASHGATPVDYSADGWAADVAAGGRPTVVFDGAGGDIGRTALDIVADGGRFSAHGAASGSFGGSFSPAETNGRRVAVTGIENAQHAPSAVADLTALAFAAAASGRLSPVIGATYPLDQAAEAHRAIEARTVLGKTLLLPK